jgi:hypothetical protein
MARPITPFDSLIRKSTNGCWHWTGDLDKGGYGIATVNRKPRRSHRVAYERHHGVHLPKRGEPGHMQVDHACHNRSKSCPGGSTCLHRRCVNPAHLVLLTAKENTEASVHTAAHVNRRKTHCVHLHEFTVENTYIKPNGARACKRCKAQSDTERRSRQRLERGPIPHYQSHKTHCPRDHPYSGDNLVIRPDGARGCRECRRLANGRYNVRRRAHA